MSKIGVSGVFGEFNPDYTPIENAEDAAEVVNELTDEAAAEAQQTAEEYMLTVQELGNIAGEYARRIRLLTWGLVAVVVYLVIKAIKQFNTMNVWV